MTDLLLVGHGSRDPRAAVAFEALRRAVAARLPDRRVGGGFLELADPPIDEALDALVADGATDVVAVPYVLFGAGHLKDDGPAILARARRRHPSLNIRLARDLGIEPSVLAVAEDRSRAALDRLSAQGPRPAPQTGAVVLVGRGSTDPDACADLVKFARLLGDGRGLGTVEAAFVAMSQPSVIDALDRVHRLGATQVAVVPLFLFEGVLVERISAQVAAWAEERTATPPPWGPPPRVEVGDPLGIDDRLADLVVARHHEAVHGAVRMNCDLCTYRVRLPGFEERVGTPLSLAPPERKTRGWRARRASNQAAAQAAQRRERPRQGLGRRVGIPTPPRRAGSAVKVADLRHSWPDGTEALAGVDLQVSAGERLAILGPNGSGKSTLALHLVGALGGSDGSTWSGSVQVAGIDTRRGDLGLLRRRVGLVFQDPDDQILLPTVAADVGFAPRYQGCSAREVEERVAAALDVVGLTDLAERAPEHLSLGERCRVALAGVLAAHPEVLVLDEPTANLDPAARRDLIEVVRGLALTTIVVTHDLPLALELCPRSVVLAHGRVAVDGPTSALLADPGLLAAHRMELPYRMVLPTDP